MANRMDLDEKGISLPFFHIATLLATDFGAFKASLR